LLYSLNYNIFQPLCFLTKTWRKIGNKTGRRIELKLVASIKMIPMNTYYLHDGTVLSGPFSLDELKAKK
jgi:hypothetical protein